TLASPLVFPDAKTGTVTVHGNGITINANGQPSGLFSFANDLSLDHFTITGVGGSTSTTDAGAIVAQGAALHVSNCTMRANAPHAIGLDAGVLFSDGGTLTMSSCTLTGNTVRSDGRGDAAVVLSEGREITASGCTVSSNHVNAAGDGATVLSEGGFLHLSSCTVSKNTVVAGGDVGGGADSEGGGVTFASVTDTCNAATSDGGDAAGGLLSEGGNATIGGSKIAGNTASTSGDGIAKSQVNVQGGSV